MEIRVLGKQEILPALHLVWEVFAEDVAPQYTPEGVGEFQKFIKYDNINKLYQSGELIFFGAFEGIELRGVMAVKTDGHISLFFVKKQYQGKGIGSQLYQTVYEFMAYMPGAAKLTVNAAPQAVPQYVHMGMHQTGPETEEHGIRYVPMETPPFENRNQRPEKKSKAPLIVAVVTVCLVLLFSVIYVIGTRMREVIDYSHDHSTSSPHGSYSGNYPGAIEGNGQSDGKQEKENTGIAAIQSYMADGLDFSVEDGSYTYKDPDKTKTYIEFNVSYPKLTGMKDEQAQNKVNETLKNCAMETVERIYNNPSGEQKEKVITSKAPALVSYVNYKVCYLNQDIISVAFEDYACEGNAQEISQYLRTVNIGLKDGQVYEVKDILNIDDRFMDEFLEEMRDETGNNKFLDELSREDLKKSLEGDSLNGVYMDNFFLNANGIEIGYSFHYPADDVNNSGYVWVTAPFDMDDIREYKSDSDFWNYVQ